MRLCLCPALPVLSHRTQPAPRDPAKLCGSVQVLLDFWAGLWLPLRLGSEGAQDPLRCHGVPQKSNKSKNSFGISLWKVFWERKPRAETSREPQDLPPPPPCFASSLVVAAWWLSGARTATGQHYRSSRLLGVMASILQDRSGLHRKALAFSKPLVHSQPRLHAGIRERGAGFVDLRLAIACEMEETEQGTAGVTSRALLHLLKEMLIWTKIS